MRDCLRDRLSWGSVQVRGFADYLGFVLGLDAAEAGWGKIFTKITERAALWAQAALGHFWATAVYNTFIAAILALRLQLEPLPPQWPQAEEAMLRKLFPGPGK